MVEEGLFVLFSLITETDPIDYLGLGTEAEGYLNSVLREIGLEFLEDKG